MTARKIDIDPDLWARVRIRAFEEKTTAQALVTKAILMLLDDPAAKITTVAPTREQAERVFEAAKRAAPVSSDAAPRSAPPPTEGDFTLEHDAAGQQIITPHPKEDPWQDLAAKPKLISTPEEAAQAAASLPSFRPVPKPSSRSSRTRSRSKSRTDQPEP